MKKAYKILIILLIIVTIITTVKAIKTSSLPLYEYEKHTLENNGQLYEMSDPKWSVIEKGELIAKTISKNSNKIEILFFPNKIYSVKNDETNTFLWYEPFLSEFGGEMYVVSDFKFPLLEELNPEKVIIGSYWAEKSIKNDIYAYSNSEEIIDIFENIVNETFEYDYTKLNLSELKETYNKMPYFSVISEQVEGCAYSTSISCEDGKYYIYSDENGKKYDVTYLLFKIINDGIITK